MEKKVNRTWLFLLLLAVAAAVVMLWFCAGKTTGSYSGGILIELPKNMPQTVLWDQQQDVQQNMSQNWKSVHMTAEDWV